MRIPGPCRVVLRAGIMAEVLGSQPGELFYWIGRIPTRRGVMTWNWKGFYNGFPPHRFDIVEILPSPPAPLRPILSPSTAYRPAHAGYSGPVTG